jgi:hypothetical protein
MDATIKPLRSRSIDADYVLSKAICYGFVAKNETKIERKKFFLAAVSRNQVTRDDIMYELANTYVANKQILALKHLTD